MFDYWLEKRLFCTVEDAEKSIKALLMDDSQWTFFGITFWDSPDGLFCHDDDRELGILPCMNDVGVADSLVKDGKVTVNRLAKALCWRAHYR